VVSENARTNEREVLSSCNNYSWTKWFHKKKINKCPFVFCYIILTWIFSIHFSGLYIDIFCSNPIGKWNHWPFGFVAVDVTKRYLGLQEFHMVCLIRVFLLAYREELFQIIKKSVGDILGQWIMLWNVVRCVPFELYLVGIPCVYKSDSDQHFRLVAQAFYSLPSPILHVIITLLSALQATSSCTSMQVQNA
jgi:hypothetical protein